MQGGELSVLLLHHLDLPPPLPPTFEGKYHKYVSSLVRPFCLQASRTTSSHLQQQQFIFRIFIHRLSFPSVSERAKTAVCFSGGRDHSHRSSGTFTLGQPRFPLHTAALLPLYPMCVLQLICFPFHNLGSLVIEPCTLPRITGYKMSPQDAHVLIAGTNECYFTWQKKLCRCD